MTQTITSAMSQYLQVLRHRTAANVILLTSIMGDKTQIAYSAFQSPADTGVEDAEDPVVEMVNVETAGAAPGVMALAANAQAVDGGNPAAQLRVIGLLKPFCPVAVIVNFAAEPCCMVPLAGLTASSKSEPDCVGQFVPFKN